MLFQEAHLKQGYKREFSEWSVKVPWTQYFTAMAGGSIPSHKWHRVANTHPQNKIPKDIQKRLKVKGWEELC